MYISCEYVDTKETKDFEMVNIDGRITITLAGFCNILRYPVDAITFVLIGFRSKTNIRITGQYVIV